MFSSLAVASLSVGVFTLFAACGSPDHDAGLPDWLQQAPGAELVRLEDGRTMPSRLVDSRTGIELILVQPAQFDMGSGTEIGHGDEKPMHRVAITAPYYLGSTEVTVGAWRKFVAATGDLSADANGGKTITSGDAWEELAAASWRDPFPQFDFKLRDDHPACLLSWDDTSRFCKHYGYRLPTEAEWEMAARAGTRTQYWWGDEAAAGAGKGNFHDATTLARFPGFSTAFEFDDTHLFLAPVASFEPNPWGFHDMLGNVAEWCHNGYTPNEYEGRDAGTTVDPSPEESGRGHAIRGGAWNGGPGYVRCARRFNNQRSNRFSIYGFRVLWLPAERAPSLKKRD